MALSADARNRLFIAVTDQTIGDEISDAIDQSRSAPGLAATTLGNGAALVGVHDAAGLFAAADVEAALLELVKYVPVTLADPGDGAAIPVTRSATVAFTVAGTETNSLAVPNFVGQRLVLVDSTQTSGTRAVACAQAINQAGNTTMTFAQARDTIVLQGISVGGNLRWQVVANDGVALS